VPQKVTNSVGLYVAKCCDGTDQVKSDGFADESLVPYEHVQSIALPVQRSASQTEFLESNSKKLAFFSPAH
jgi:hypothetical protein